MDPQFIALKAELYAKAGAYDHARSAYLAAKASHALPETVNDLATTCYELGWGYTAALDGLLDFLAERVQSEERDAEVERASRFKELVRRELKLITPL